MRDWRRAVGRAGRRSPAAHFTGHSWGPAPRLASDRLALPARFGTKDFCDAQCDFLHKAHFHCVVEECGALFSTLDGAIKHAK